jgi:hypothetical protein
MNIDILHQIADRNLVRRANVDTRDHVKNRVVLSMMDDIDTLIEMVKDRAPVEAKNEKGEA